MTQSTRSECCPPAQGVSLRPRRSIWRLSSQETTVALAFAVAVTWISLVVLIPLRQPVLGGDFIEFYTLATAAREGNWSIAYDWPALHELQVSLVPGSDAYFYPPSYPPLVPVLYLPLTLLQFPLAYLIWVLLSTLLYCGLLVAVTGERHSVTPSQTLLAGLLFPPFIAHQALGQTTVWPLLGFVGGWYALSRSRPVVAGLILSIVAVKPHLGMALAVVLLSVRLWSVVVGITLGLTLQALATLWICGLETVSAYVITTLSVLGDSRLISPADGRFTHGLRTSLESVLPHYTATLAWLASSALFGWLLVKTWRRTEDWTLRFSTLLLATLLISPHVQAYDAILLAPVVFWLSAWAIPARHSAIVPVLLVLSAAFVVPFTRFWGIPLTIPLMAWLLWECQRLVMDDPGTSALGMSHVDRAGTR